VTSDTSAPPPATTPAPPPARAHARLQRAARAVHRALSEQSMLDALPREVKVAVVRRIAQQEAQKIASFGWLMLPIAVLLFRVDLARWHAGLFAQSWVWPALAVTHAVVAASAIPALLLAARRRREPFLSSKALQGTFLWLLALSTMAMALLSIRYRETAFEFNIALVATNLVYYTPAAYRVPFTLAATVAALLMVPPRDAHEVAEHVALVNEIVVTTIAYAIIASGVARLRLQAVQFERELFAQAKLDALTGVSSRRRVEEGLSAALAGRRADLGPGLPSRPTPVHGIARERTAVILVDLDHFKSVNDTYGHTVGDTLLTATARVLQQRIRLDDVVGRWGGEEFLIVCPSTGLEDAAALAETLRARIAARDFPGIGSRTASLGVAASAPGDTATSLVERADAALYEAKRLGRNRVVVADGSSLQPIPTLPSPPVRD
jgi:diguanylate cyclase (GGDEF)-like protein